MGLLNGWFPYSAIPLRAGVEGRVRLITERSPSWLTNGRDEGCFCMFRHVVDGFLPLKTQTNKRIPQGPRGSCLSARQASLCTKPLCAGHRAPGSKGRPQCYAMRGGSAATKSSLRRLPINQRRHRVAPENRKRVTTAYVQKPPFSLPLAMPYTPRRMSATDWRSSQVQRLQYKAHQMLGAATLPAMRQGVQRLPVSGCGRKGVAPTFPVRRAEVRVLDPRKMSRTARTRRGATAASDCSCRRRTTRRHREPRRFGGPGRRPGTRRLPDT